LLATAIGTAALLVLGDDDQKATLLPRIASGEVATLVTGELVLTGDIALQQRGSALEVCADDLERVGSLDQTLSLSRLSGAPSVDGPLMQVAWALTSALQVGAAQRGLDMTVAYSKERVQFGRPIGSFQALKHRMADMLVLVEMARSAAWSAAAGSLDPDIAAAYCIEAAQKVAAETIQLHGGIAITWEHDAHLVFKRAHALGQLVAQPHELRAGLTLSP
jgi:alkylation response protein AidB-like acyl-CoA dehydrogenase